MANSDISLKEDLEKSPHNGQNHEKYDIEPKDLILFGDDIIVEFVRVNQSSLVTFGEIKGSDAFKTIVVNKGPKTDYVDIGDNIFCFHGMGFQFSFGDREFMWLEKRAVKWIIEKVK